MSSTQKIKEVKPDLVNSFWVFLTVPHENCPEENFDKHPCDIFAKEASECLYNAQIEKTEVTILKPFIPTNTPRTVCDLNRKWCRKNKYRQEVANFVSNNDNVQFVLDVHSYPGNIEEWGEYSLVVIDDKIPNLEDYTLDFVDFMGKANIKILPQHGNGNDIHVQMRELKKKSMLLEFNEELKKDQDELNKICRTIAFWFKTLATQ